MSILKTSFTLDRNEIDTLTTIFEYAIKYADEGAKEAYNSMERRDVIGWDIEIQNFADLAKRLGLTLKLEE